MSLINSSIPPRHVSTPSRNYGSSGQRASDGWPVVLVALFGLSFAGWLYLGSMLAGIATAGAAGDLGPGMAIFDRLSPYYDLPPDVRKAILTLCLPAAATGENLWVAENVASIAFMWGAMALAMMLPTAIPMLKTYFHKIPGEVSRHRRVAMTIVAGGGYLSVWMVYAIAAALLQLILTRLSLLSPLAGPVSLALSASILVAAGIYQFTPAKFGCLNRCWYPRFPELEHGLGESRSSFATGVREGLYCMGCCFALMTVMFAVGAMNVVWMVVLGGIMVVEKTFPSRVFPRVIGAGLLLWGVGIAYFIYSASLV